MALSFIYKNCPISVMFGRYIFQTMSAKELAAMHTLFPSIAEQRYSVLHANSPFHHSHDKKYKQ